MSAPTGSVLPCAEPFYSRWDAIRDYALVLSFIIGAVGTIWFPDRLEPKLLFGFAMAAMAICAWKTRKPVPRQSPAVTPAATDWLQMAMLTTVGGTILFVVCNLTGAWQGEKLFGMLDKSWSHWLSVKLPTVLGQQLMLQLLLAPVIFRLCGRVWIAAAGCASVFAMLHLPNPVLMGLTFVAGLVWVAWYHRTHRIAPVVVSHFVLAVLTAGLCGEYVFNMRVGPPCVALFPSLQNTVGGTVYEFPRCVTGCTEQLVQYGDELILKGWAVDSVHDEQPERLFFKRAGMLHPIEDVEFQEAPMERWKNATDSGFVGDACYAFVARLELSDLDPADPVQIYCANANGHVAELGRMGEIKPLARAPVDRPIRIFPVEVDGRVFQTVYANGQLRLRGWIADLRNGTVPDQVYIECDDQTHLVDVDKSHFPFQPAADRYQQPGFANSGFEVVLSNVVIRDPERIQCYVSDSAHELHPIVITGKAQTRVATPVVPSTETKLR